MLLASLTLLLSSCRSDESFAPSVPNLKLLYRIPLEDVSFYSRSGHFPDLFIAISPREDLLAAGTFLGKIVVARAQTGDIIWKKNIHEGMVKKIAFSTDASTIYYGEQGPDGFIYACDAETGTLKWRFPLARDLLPGTPPEKKDIYGVYEQPGCYRLKVLRNGDLLVLGIHSWMDRKAGYWRRLSRIYRLSSKGEVRWAWPEEGPMEISLIYADCDPAGTRVATVATLPSDRLPQDYPYAPGTFFVLDGESGQETGRYTIPPLEPYFKRVSIWESVAVDPTGQFGAVGTSDGRGFIFDLATARPRKVLNLGTPVMIGDTPVAATSTYVHISNQGTIFFQTGASTIPFGMRLSANRPAGPHPNAQTLWAVSPQGEIIWRFTSGFHLQGLATDTKGTFLVTAAGSSMGDVTRSDQFGLFVLNTLGRNNLHRLHAYYPTSAPLFFHLAVTPSGRLIAAGETPYVDERGSLKGQYQIHVLQCEPVKTPTM